MGAQPWSRRRFLRSAGRFAVGFPTLAAVLAACAPDGPDGGTAAEPAGLLPLHDDLLIDPAAPIERGGVLRIFEWRDYLDHGVVQAFARRYAAWDVDVHIDSFTSMPEAIARLQEPGSSYDIFFPVIDALPGLVRERVLRPLNHEALPHLGSLWTFFTAPDGPFYDVGLRYTVPYTVYSTGIGWRHDLVAPARSPDRLASPYDAFWDQPTGAGVGLVDDYREVIAMALLRRGLDPNGASPQDTAAAVDDLIAMTDVADVEIATAGAYEELQTGEYAIQQAWSGDVLSAERFGPGTAATLSETGYLWPAGGIVGCDLTAVCATGRNPVLAHAFIDHLLHEEIALENFRWNGYQPPVWSATRDAFRDRTSRWADVVPAHLLGALLDPGDLQEGRFLRALPSAEDALWRTGWDRLRDAVGLDPSDAS